MATTLWSKGYELDQLIASYGASRNAALDGQLVSYDLLGSLAHARMLCRIGILELAEWRELDHALRAMLADAHEFALAPTADEEDVHTAIERALVERVGPSGKKIHTGRSRNDQVLVDLRLLAKDRVLQVVAHLLETAGNLAALARRHEWTPMPGYTHMQRAMLSSVGLWAAAYAEALLDDTASLAAAYALNDASPLGSAAAYGVPLPLDREYTAHLLGFARAEPNVLTAANARGKGEAAVVQALALVMLDVSKWAQDVLLFTTAEFGFFDVPAELCDGSSIMPQKHNLSALELVRARAHSVVALQGQMLSTLVGLPSGYNMDYQETKAPLLEALHLCEESLRVVGLFASRLAPRDTRLADACSPELFATDHAYELAATGVPFRDAYGAVAAAPAAQDPGDLQARLRARSHLGAPGNLDLAGLEERLAQCRAVWRQRRHQLDAALELLGSGDLPDPRTHTIAPSDELSHQLGVPGI